MIQIKNLMTLWISVDINRCKYNTKELKITKIFDLMLKICNFAIKNIRICEAFSWLNLIIFQKLNCKKINYQILIIIKKFYNLKNVALLC